MIRKNSQLNCNCIDGTSCPQGSDYANQKNAQTGRLHCEKIDKVEPVDIDALDDQITEYNSTINMLDRLRNMVNRKSVPQPARNREKTVYQRTIDLFDETHRDQITGKAGTKNDLNRIRMMLDIAPVMRSYIYEEPKQDKVPRKMTAEEEDSFVRACDRLEAIQSDDIDLLPYVDEILPTNYSRENQVPVWDRYGDGDGDGDGESLIIEQARANLLNLKSTETDWIQEDINMVWENLNNL